MYKSVCIDLLELSFLLNLVILSSTLLYLQVDSDSDASLCRYTSASITVSIVQYIGIMAYHAVLQMNKFNFFKSTTNSIYSKWQSLRHPVGKRAQENRPAVNPVVNMPTTSTLELREALLASET